MTPSPICPCRSGPILPGTIVAAPVRRGWAPWLTPLVCLLVLCMLAACTSRQGRHSVYSGPSSRYYPPPGPPEDPWGPYISRASARFGVPDAWIREVMRRESAGRPNAYSSAGAMGLMQVMPGTYAELQVRYGLGDDPYEPLSNIMAGTAYIREMYDRYGAPGFLAAYNAGPRRLEDYLGGGRDLPDETVNYVAAIAPRLGPSTPMSGPLAVYAGNGVPVAVAAVAATPRDACDPDAAYDPTRTCAAGGWQGPVAAPVVAAVPAPVTAPPAPSALPSLAAGDPCDPDAAYDPTRPCVVPARGPVAQEALAAPRTLPPAPPPPSPFRPTLAAGRVDAASALGRGWAVQVGAFSTTVTARMAADRARTAAPAPLQRARLELSSIERHGSGLLYRARLTGLTADEASGACASLSRSGLACAIIRPDAERSW